MGFTVQHISNIGSPPDDPLLRLPADLYLPDPTVFLPPRPCMVGTVSSGFSHGGISLYGTIFGTGGLVEQGFMCLACSVRHTNPIPGQTTTGRWHQQTDDLKIGIRAMRSNPLRYVGFPEKKTTIGRFRGGGSVSSGRNT